LADARKVNSFVSSEYRESRKDHLHIDARIERCSIAIGDMLILVANRETVTVAVYDLKTATEIEGKVKARSACDRYLFIEVNETAGGLAEGFNSTIAAEVEFQTDGRRTPAKYALTIFLNDESGSRRYEGEAII
jgi:hypothetical protein